MTEPRMAEMLTGLSALRDALVNDAAEIAALADEERKTAKDLRDKGYMRLATQAEARGATAESVAGRLASGLERLGRLIGDAKGETLAETTRMSTSDLAATRDD